MISQLKGYVSRIEDHINDYKNCYEQNFKQKKELGLIDKPADINIVKGVVGAVVVMGYSGLAQKSIKQLKRKDPSITVIQLSNRLQLKNLN